MQSAGKKHMSHPGSILGVGDFSHSSIVVLLHLLIDCPLRTVKSMWYLTHYHMFTTSFTRYIVNSLSYFFSTVIHRLVLIDIPGWSARDTSPTAPWPLLWLRNGPTPLTMELPITVTGTGFAFLGRAGSFGRETFGSWWWACSGQFDVGGKSETAVGDIRASASNRLLIVIVGGLQLALALADDITDPGGEASLIVSMNFVSSL